MTTVTKELYLVKICSKIESSNKHASESQLGVALQAVCCVASLLSTELSYDVTESAPCRGLNGLAVPGEPNTQSTLVT